MCSECIISHFGVFVNSPKSAEVCFVVAWKGEEDTEETPIILANMIAFGNDSQSKK